MSVLSTTSFFISLVWIFTASPMQATLADRLTYIVHMDKSFMSKAFATHHDWYSATMDSLVVNSTERLLYTYDNAIHGFSAVLSFEELQELEKSPGFVHAYPDMIVYPDTTYTFEFLSLNTVSGLWPASEYGNDVIVGMMDSGVYPESKSFGDDGMSEVPARWKGICQDAYNFNSSMCNRKLIGARGYNKGYNAANPHSGEEYPNSPSPRDHVGHGTHTSSTVAGNYVEGVSFFGYAKGTARGIAPRARLSMYRVIGTTGAGSDLLAGMDQAIADGVDIISISMGVGGPIYEDPIAIAAFAAMEKGVLVSSSAGNDGPDPMSLHNGIPWILTVGASTIDRQFSAILTLGNGVSITGWSQFPENAIIVDYPLIYNDTLLSCNSTKLLSEAARGKIVICIDEAGDLNGQIDQVYQSDVAGALFISNNTEYEEVYDFQRPGVLIKPADAPQLIHYAKTAHYVTATLKFQHDVFGARPTPAVAYYTSRGPAPHYPTILKPDIMAPGSKVVAAWVPTTLAAKLAPDLELSSDYKAVSGTSMACPHASGVAALLKGAHPNWSPAAIRSAMMTTASQIGNDGHPIRDNGANLAYATPLDMGAGQISPNKALDPGLIYDVGAQDYVNHLCFLNFTKKQITAITRSSKYNCSTASSDLNYPSFMVFLNGTSSNVHEFRRTVTNVGDGASTYKAKLEVPPGTSVKVSPDTLVFGEKYEKLDFSVSVDIQEMKGTSSYGSLVWEDDGAKHIVRSPIVVYRMVNT